MSENKLNIETKVRRLKFYLEDIERGLLQIPPFQRDKIWDNTKRKDLFDSLKNGYPIGSILLWKPESLSFEKSIERIGPYNVPTGEQTNFLYILDGFQRLSTLFGCLTDPNKTNLVIDTEEWEKDFNICYDFENEDFFIPRRPSNLSATQVQIYKLMDTRSAFSFERGLQNLTLDEKQISVYMDRYEKLANTLIDYSLAATEIRGGGIEDAVEIFSRVNSKGSIISPDWMVSALSYNQGFRLATEIDNLLENLKKYNFDTIKRELILQCIANAFDKVYFDQMTKKDNSKISKLIKQPNFIEKAQSVLNNIPRAVQFLFEELWVIDAKLLPYGSQLIFITDFFNQVEKPTENHLNKLKEWFWITTYSNYFTIYALSKQREAYYQFQKFIKDENENAVYNDRPDSPFETYPYPNKIYFGSVRANAFVLFMLKYAANEQKADADSITGVYLSPLFFDMRDDKGNFYPENMIISPTRIQKEKDMSIYLENYKSDYEKYFLTKNLAEIFSNQNATETQNTILKLRKQLIIDAEKTFVEESLRLKYYSDF